MLTPPPLATTGRAGLAQRVEPQLEEALAALLRELEPALTAGAKRSAEFQASWGNATTFRGSHVLLELGVEGGKPAFAFKINGDLATLREVQAEAPTPAAVAAFVERSGIEARAWVARQAKRASEAGPGPELPGGVLKNIASASAPSSPDPAVSAAILGASPPTSAHQLYFAIARMGQILGLPVAPAVDQAIREAKLTAPSKRQRSLLTAEQKSELKGAARAFAAQDFVALALKLNSVRRLQEALGTPRTAAELKLEMELTVALEAHHIGTLCDEIERVARDKDVNRAYLAVRARDDIPAAIERVHDRGYELPPATLARAAAIAEHLPEIERLNALRIEAEHPEMAAQRAEGKLRREQDLHQLDPKATAEALAKIDEAELSPRAKAEVLRSSYQRALFRDLDELKKLLRTANPFEARQAERLLGRIEERIAEAKASGVDLQRDPHRVYVLRLEALSNMALLVDAVASLKAEYDRLTT